MIGSVAEHADAGAFGEPLLDVGPEIQRDNRFVLTLIGRPLVNDLAEVDAVLEQVEQTSPPKGDAATSSNVTGQASTISPCVMESPIGGDS